MHIKIIGKRFFEITDNTFDNYCLPVLLFFIRYWIAKIFFYSGLTKISDWETTILLFKDLYKVPGLNPEIAAFFTTAIELCCPALLVIGLTSRLASVPMLVVTIVIQYTYQSANEHIYWAILLALILLLGPGRISLDYLIRLKFQQFIKQIIAD